MRINSAIWPEYSYAGREAKRSELGLVSRPNGWIILKRVLEPS
jgi:hypothetical protein